MANPRSGPALGELAAASLLALGVTALAHWLFFLLAPLIRSFNRPISPGEIVPWVLPWTQVRDGIETYALYVLALAVIGGTALVCGWLLGERWRFWAPLSGKPAPARRLTLAILLTLPLLVLWVRQVGFVPPQTPLQSTGWTWQTVGPAYRVFAVTAALSVIALAVQARAPRWLTPLIALLLVPACLIPTDTSPGLLVDYNYVLLPALRLLSGAALSDIYFQYGPLPPMLAAAWLSMGLEPSAFRLVGQAAYYVAILSVFFLAKRLFLVPATAILLIAALVIGRLYTSNADVLCCLQITPLRIDLWLPLVIVVWLAGAWHLSAGLVCGILLLVAHKFGVIYTLAYLQALVVLLTLQLADRDPSVPPTAVLRRAALRVYPGVGLIIGCYVLSSLLLKNESYGDYARHYLSVGIGFLPISESSFYWYVLPTISLTLILLLRLRALVTQRYLQTAVLLVFCAAGSLIYFYGRSHEQALLNLSISLLVIVFLLLDLTTRLMAANSDSSGSQAAYWRIAPLLFGGLLIAGMAVWYGEHIATKFSRQLAALSRGEITYPLSVDRDHLERELTAIRAATGDSDRVYFLAAADFDYYYFGGYRPVGYVNPFWAWIFTDDLRVHLDTLLDAGWFLVIAEDMRDIPSKLGLEHDFERDAAGLLIIARSAALGPSN
jgi:hypothetical protein